MSIEFFSKLYYLTEKFSFHKTEITMKGTITSNDRDW